MKIKKLILHNYKQHPHKELAFDGNVIGVVGRNGSGKSNLLGGLQFAFAGEQPGFTKADLLRWGASDGYVQVDFDHAGKPGHIERSLTGSYALFTYGGDTYRGINKVGEGIQLHLGLDKDLLKQAIFVRQAEIDAILFEDPRERELAFQKLCGIGDAAKIHKRLGDELTRLSMTPINYDEQLAEANKRFADMQGRMTQLQTTASAAAEQHAKLPTLSSLQSTIMSYTSMLKTIEQYVKTSNELADAKGRLAELESHVDSTPDNAAEDITMLDQQLVELDQSMRLAEEYQRRLKAFEEAGKAVMALGDTPQPPTLPYTDAQILDLMQKAEAFNKAYADASANERLYADLARTLRDKPLTECPVCGGPIKDLQRIQQKMAEYHTTVVNIGMVNYAAQHQEATTKQQQVIQTYNKAVEQYNLRYGMLVSQFAKAEEAMKSAPKVNQAMAELVAARQRASEKRTHLTNILREVSARQQERKSCAQRIEALSKELSMLHTTIVDMEDVAKQLAFGGVKSVPAYIQQRINSFGEQSKQIHELDQHMAQIQGMIREMSNSLNVMENTIKALETKRAMEGPYRGAVQTLTNVRDWFHYNNGPHHLATAVLAEMNQDVNNFLGQFSAPFSVIQGSEALGFKCIFHDGRDMPPEPPDAHHLSGGQKIQLAIAFRFASYCMFASKLGLLSLDEPTVYLDDQNVGAFCTLLQKIKEVAQKMDLQVLLATHERAVMPFIDTVISLTD